MTRGKWILSKRMKTNTLSSQNCNIPWIGNQIGLELVQVHIESSVKAEGSGDGADNLADQPVQVGVAWSLDVQVAATDVIDGLVVHHESTVAVFKGGVGTKSGVVGLNYSSGNLEIPLMNYLPFDKYLGRRINAELQFRLLAIVHRQPLHQKGGEARSSPTAKRVEDEKAL